MAIKRIMTLTDLIHQYRDLGIDQQIDFEKLYVYAIIAHSTAIEGSTITEEENQILLDENISIKGRTIEEQLMNLDLKEAYEYSRSKAAEKQEISIEFLKCLSAKVMRRTGEIYNTALGLFDASRGDLRLINVSAGRGGKSYMTFNKVPDHLKMFCQWLNDERKRINPNNIEQLYRLSFEAHLKLVTIHPWANGNGRTSRLLMNHIQFEYGLIPTIILKEEKEEYIKALKSSQDMNDTKPFMDFMIGLQINHLKIDIENYQKSNEKKTLFPSKKMENDCGISM